MFTTKITSDAYDIPGTRIKAIRMLQLNDTCITMQSHNISEIPQINVFMNLKIPSYTFGIKPNHTKLSGQNLRTTW